MSPKGRDQLTHAEIDLLYAWIATGASFDKKIGEFTDEKIVTYLTALRETVTSVALDDTAIPALDEQLIVELRAKGIIVMPLSKNIKFAKAFFLNPKTITDKELELLKPFAQNLISLKLTRTSISEKSSSTLADFKNLRVLELDYTAITDQALMQLTTLTKLERVNLVSTPITEKGIISLASLASLKEIYLFNSKVTKQGLIDFHTKNPNIMLDTGNYKLRVRPTDTLVYTRNKAK